MDPSRTTQYPAAGPATKLWNPTTGPEEGDSKESALRRFFAKLQFLSADLPPMDRGDESVRAPLFGQFVQYFIHSANTDSFQVFHFVEMYRDVLAQLGREGGDRRGPTGAAALPEELAQRAQLSVRKVVVAEYFRRKCLSNLALQLSDPEGDHSADRYCNEDAGVVDAWHFVALVLDQALRFEIGNILLVDLAIMTGYENVTGEIGDEEEEDPEEVEGVDEDEYDDEEEDGYEDDDEGVRMEE